MSNPKSYVHVMRPFRLGRRGNRHQIPAGRLGGGHQEGPGQVPCGHGQPPAPDAGRRGHQHRPQSQPHSPGGKARGGKL